MSRDGLLPPAFAKVHPKFSTPSFSTIITGLMVGVPILFTNESFVLDFTSIGTIFAFVLVCGGVLLLPPRKEGEGKGFVMPYINGKYMYSIVIAASIVMVLDFTDWIVSNELPPQLVVNTPVGIVDLCLFTHWNGSQQLVLVFRVVWNWLSGVFYIRVQKE
jgi:amino acid transporter